MKFMKIKFSNSLIINEENTKEITTVKEWIFFIFFLFK